MMNLANILTMSRLVILLPLVVLFYIGTDWAAWTCAGLFALGALTDWLDGWAARRYGQVSEFGKLMDPITDKIFVIAVLMMLIAADRVAGLWVLPVIIIVAREFLVSGLREYLGPLNVALPVTPLAKWKTTAQMIATTLLIDAAAAAGPWLVYTGLTALAVAGLLTVMTGWGYLKTGLRHVVK